MQITDPIAGASRATGSQAAVALSRVVVAVASWDREFATALDNACAVAGVDFAIAYAHCANETDYFRSAYWNENLNPAGIGITGEPGETGPVFPSAAKAARFYVALLLLKLKKGGDVGFLEAERATAPSYFDGTRAFARDPSFPTVRTLGDLCKRFGPNNRECVWMCDPSGPQAICAKANVLFPNLPTPKPAPPVTFDKPRQFTLLPTAVLRTYPGRAGSPAIFVGYVHGESIGGDDRWLTTGGSKPVYVHASGVGETF